jgi:hypothetical protein
MTRRVQVLRGRGPRCRFVQRESELDRRSVSCVRPGNLLSLLPWHCCLGRHGMRERTTFGTKYLFCLHRIMPDTTHVPLHSSFSPFMSFAAQRDLIAAEYLVAVVLKTSALQDSLRCFRSCRL